MCESVFVDVATHKQVLDIVTARDNASYHSLCASPFSCTEAENIPAAVSVLMSLE